MISSLTSTVRNMFDFTWPMLVISMVILISLRVTFLIKNKQRIIIYKELITFSFIIYILCLFQVVTFQDNISFGTNNLIPFKEIFRYNIGSKLFVKNVLGNMLLFMPYGFFVGYYLKSKKPMQPLILSLIASLSIEIVQLVIGRVFDIDDVILNLLGGYIGYLIYYFLYKIGDKMPIFLKKEIFLNIFSIIILICVILIVF